MTGPMGYTDAVTRITQIQAEVAGLRTAFDPARATTSTSSATASTATPSPTATTFAAKLAQAQASSAANAAGSATDLTSSAGDIYGSEPAATGGLSLPYSSLPTSTTAPSAAGSSSATLPAGAQSMLTSDQQQFASRLAADTGLDAGVISAWLLAEESGGAAQSRQAQSNNDWLNIGYTDSGTYGSADSVWSDPISAADATAGWLKGQNTIRGYGTASSGIQAILATTGSTPQAQIAALQQSGWASSGYPDLPALYSQISA